MAPSALPPATAPMDEPPLAKVMYDREPQTYGTFEALHGILRNTGGDLMTINHAQFDRVLGRGLDGVDLLQRLAANGVDIATVDGEVLDKTGLLGLMGTLNRIESGCIRDGARVLVCLTGGTARPSARATPESYVRRTGAEPGVVWTESEQ